jgi:hypothetical protein
VSFYCDDIKGTVARPARARRRVHRRCRRITATAGVTYFTIPGGITVQLYEPKYRKGAGRVKAKAKAAVKKVKAAARQGQGGGQARAATKVRSQVQVHVKPGRR